VHATHVTEEETARVAEAGAVVGLCPTTEANLGDGVFPAPAFLAAGGAFGIGSDSHISVSPIEELRWLEYGQRLTRRRRNLLAAGVETPSVGAGLYRGALAGGAQALGRPIGRLATGYRADLVVLDDDSPTLYGKPDDLLLDALVFAGNANPVRDVMVGGAWVVREGCHPRETEIFAAYRETVDSLRA
jgi:formimidoylglutamate deiminase